MKTLARILNIVTSALLVILGAAFVFIEGFLLFSGDFLLFEIEAIAFIQMLLRLCLGAGAATLGFFCIIKGQRAFLFEALLLLVCCLVTAPLLTNGFGFYFIILASAFTLTNLFYAKCVKR